MRLSTIALLVAVPVGLSLACNDKKDSSGGGGGGTKEEDTVTAGTLAVVTGTIQPAEGADVSTVAGALVEAEGHPEISAVTDENGNFGIENVLPGTIALYVGSNDGGAAALKLEDGKGIGPTVYGLKIPDVVLKSGEVTDLGEQPLKKTGGFSGKVVFYSNPNKLDLTGSDVFVPGTGFIVKTDANGAFALGGLPPGKYSLRAQHTGFAVLDIKDVEVPEGATTDLGDLTLSLSTGPEGDITITAKDTADIGARKGAKFVTDRLVKVKLKYDSDAALMKVSDDPSFTNQEWKPVKSDVDWKFESDGLKTLYVMYSDLNGLESSPYSDEVFVDTKAPTISGARLLYGWGEVAEQSGNGATVPMSVDGDDDGTGIQSVRWSANADMTGSEYQDFKGGKISNVVLSSGAGSKLIYVQVKDFAGFESSIEKDSISLGTQSVIAKMTYVDDVVLTPALNPYTVSTNVTIAKNVTLLPGTVLTIAASSSLDVEGVFKSVGGNTAPTRIKIDGATSLAPTCSSAGMGKLILRNGLPGVSEDNEIRRTDIGTLTVEVNGGDIIDNKMGEIACTSGGGILAKYGRDKLTVLDNTYTNWDVALDVREGTSVVTFKDNDGNVQKAYRQAAGVAGVAYINNDLNIYSASLSGVIEMEGGTIDMRDSEMTVADNTAILVNTVGTVDATVIGLNTSNCDTIAAVGTNVKLTLKNARISDCIRGAYATGTGAELEIDYSDIQVSRYLFYAGASGTPKSVVKRSNVVCAIAPSVSTDFCDLAYTSITYDFDLTFDSNNITCEATDSNDATADACRGFSYNAVMPQNATWTITSTSNYWIGKTLNLNPVVTASGFSNGTDPDTTNVSVNVFTNGGAVVTVDDSAGTPDAGSAYTTQVGPRSGY